MISDLISALWPAPSRALRILNSVQLPDLSRLQRPEALGRDAGGPERLGKRERRRVDRFIGQRERSEMVGERQVGAAVEERLHGLCRLEMLVAHKQRGS